MIKSFKYVMVSILLLFILLSSICSTYEYTIINDLKYVRMKYDHYIHYKGDNYVITNVSKYVEFTSYFYELQETMSRNGTRLSDDVRNAIVSNISIIFSKYNCLDSLIDTGFWLNIVYVYVAAPFNLLDDMTNDLRKLERDYNIQLVIVEYPSSRRVDRDTFKQAFDKIVYYITAIAYNEELRRSDNLPDINVNSLPKILKEIAGTVTGKTLTGGGMIPYAVEKYYPVINIIITYNKSLSYNDLYELVKYFRDHIISNEDVTLMFTVTDIRFYRDPLVLQAGDETDTNLEEHVETAGDNATCDHLDTNVSLETYVSHINNIEHTTTYETKKDNRGYDASISISLLAIIIALSAILVFMLFRKYRYG